MKPLDWPKPMRSMAVAALMLGLCGIGQAATPRTAIQAFQAHASPGRSIQARSAHKPAHHGAPLLNTTLPVPDMALPGNDRPSAPIGTHVLARAGEQDPGMAVAPAHEPANGAFPIHWRESREITGPEIISRIRNYKRDGFPVVQLWENQNQQSRVAIGVNPHGLPGIYFTHHVGG